MAGGLLEALYLAGAVPAGPGEFTRRALEHGKLSLTPAEAGMEHPGGAANAGRPHDRLD